MLGFCDNPVNRSLVLILKYIFCEFYTCTIVFKKLGWFVSKKFSKNIFAISDINLFKVSRIFKEVKIIFFASDMEKNVLLTFFMIQTILIFLITLVQR